MSKINAVRFINLNYNYDTIRISDETFHFNGESTLLKLDNGGGKSVLVQMITALFVQKRYRNVKDRPFASYFTSGKPTFILAEWLLDQNAGYVMTGMMVRRNQNMEGGNEEELDIINFISEYRKPCPQDIHHLPVIERSRDEITLKSFAICRQLFDNYKKDRSLRFFSYDMNNPSQSRQYFDKLMEYGINFREWQDIIRKVNEEESGLSKLFADCKDERVLIEKWFLETIENKLNRDQSRIQEFRNILEKYIVGYQRNQTKIRQRDTILHFEQESQRIREKAKLYLAAEGSHARKLNEIAAFIQKLLELQEEARQELENENASIEELKEKIRRTDHERLSADYYKTKDAMDAIEVRIAALEEMLAETEADRKKWESTLHLLLLAEKQEGVDASRENYQAAVQALDVCRKKGRDLEPERDYIGYLLHLHYEDVIEGIEKEIAETELSIEECSENRRKMEVKIDGLDESIRKREQEKGSLLAAIAAFDEEEQRFDLRWKVDLSRNLMGEYEAGFLQILTDTLEGDLAESQRVRSSKRKQLEKTDEWIRKLEQTLARQEEERQRVSVSLRDAEKELHQLESELLYRRAVLQYLELREEALFDKERILRCADSKISELEALIERSQLEAEQLKTTLQNLTTGQTVELSPEMQKMLESLGIQVVYGMEWMKKNGLSEQDNLALVDHNPFLPYALIMSENEFQRLERASFPVYTGSPIPIVTREALASDPAEGALLPDIAGNVHFYMMFNRNLLNEERLAAMVAQKRRELESKQEEIRRKRKENKEYLERRTRIADQTVTKDNYEAAAASITEYREELQKIRSAFAEASADLARSKKSRENLAGEIDDLAGRIKELNEEKTELTAFIQVYERYLTHKKDLVRCGQDLKSMDAEKKKLQEHIRQLEERLRLLRDKRSEGAAALSIARAEGAVYQTYQRSAAPKDFPQELSEDYAALTARYTAITGSMSREIRELEEAQKKAVAALAKSEQELKRLAGKYQRQPEDWKEIRYSAAESDHAEETIERLRQEYASGTEKKHSLDIDQTKLSKSIEHIMESMYRDCGEKIPVSREEIYAADYAAQKNILLNEKARHEKETRELERRLTVLGSNLDALSEYENPPVTYPVSFNEDFRRFSDSDFRAFTGGLKREYRGLEKAMGEQKSGLEKILQQIMRMDDFKDDYYRKPLETFSSLSGNAGQVLKQLDLVLQSYRDLMDKLMVDIAMIEEEREHVIAALKEYVEELHAQFGKIDRNSSILVRGKPLKMLKITLPAWEENDSLYQRRIEDFVDGITTKGISLLEKGESVHEFVGKRLTTKELYDGVVSIGNVHIQLYKIEAQREMAISWNEVARNSGGEGFLSAFVILSSLLYYMRRDETDIFADRNEGKVLLMDNPFAQTNASHLLKPMMEVARKNNTQLICLTGLGGESIYDRFDNIYVLKLTPAALSNVQHLRGRHIAGNEPETLSAARFEVSDGEQMELLF